MRLRYGDEFRRRRRRRVRYGETLKLGGVDGQLPSGRACARLGADRGRMQRPARGRRPATTRTCADPTCAPFELVPCDVFITEATFGLPVFRHPDRAGEIAKLLHSVALFPERAHLVGAYSLGKAQRVIALLRAGRLRRADLSARRDGKDHRAITRAAASRSASRAGARREEGRARRHHHALPAVRHVAICGRARFPDPVMRLRLGLDAGARAGPPARRRTAAGHFRSRRLGRATATIAATGAREIWVTHGAGRRAGALGAVAGPEGAAAGDLSAMATRKNADAARRGSRHEPLRRTARPPRLRARPQQQVAADRRLFAQHARPRSRLCARRADRRAHLQARQGRHDPRADRRTHRPGSVCAVATIMSATCRRPWR